MCEEKRKKNLFAPHTHTRVSVCISVCKYACIYTHALSTYVRVCIGEVDGLRKDRAPCPASPIGRRVKLAV